MWCRERWPGSARHENAAAAALPKSRTEKITVNQNLSVSTRKTSASAIGFSLMRNLARTRQVRAASDTGHDRIRPLVTLAQTAEKNLQKLVTLTCSICDNLPQWFNAEGRARRAAHLGIFDTGLPWRRLSTPLLPPSYATAFWPLLGYALARRACLRAYLRLVPRR